MLDNTKKIVDNVQSRFLKDLWLIWMRIFELGDGGDGVFY